MNLTEIADSLTVLDGKYTWSVTKDRLENEQLTRADGLKLWHRVGGYGNEGKVAINFDRPVGRNGRAPTLWADGAGQISNPSINVSITKSARQIAQDIVRRMLTESENVFKLANESIAADNAFLDGRVKTTIAIAALCGTEPERHYQSNELTFEVDPFKGAGVKKFEKHGYGKITVSSEDSVSIELMSVSFDIGVEIISAINKILSRK